MSLNKLRFGLQGLAFLDTVSTRPERTVRLKSTPAPHLLLWGPEDIAEVFRSERDMHLDQSDTLRPLVGDTSLLFANGTRHAAYRQVVGPALRGNRLAAHHPAIAETVNHAADELTRTDTFVVPEWARRLTLRIIGTILLDDEDSDLLTRVSDLVEHVLGTPSRTLRYRYLRPPTTLPSLWRTFLRDRDTLREDLTTPRPRPTTSRCPALATELTSGNPPLGPLDENELADQLMSLIFAGHETTASAIAWTLYWLACDDHLRTDLRAELTASTADGSTAAELPLLDAVCRESLRITPPATIAGHRVLTTDQELLGRPLTKGTTLTPCIHLAHRQPDTYPHPERFDPHRFLDRKWSTQHYLPFGGGTRRCLGADLAMLEMCMTIAAVLRRVELGRPSRRAGTPHRRGPAMGPAPTLTLTVRPCP
ncbi:cytochrome P450 [Streptomyces sp. NPDC087425]|uniref:cytochrome P450 n=1 Tax=Streptomyces sp. NPDC087425 TaxID=3365787 RepID=UPI0037FD1A23